MWEPVDKYFHLLWKFLFCMLLRDPGRNEPPLSTTMTSKLYYYIDFSYPLTLILPPHFCFLGSPPK